MASKTNARAIQASLEDGLKSDVKVLGSFAKLAAFGAAAVSGEPMSFIAATGKVLEAAAAATEGASELVQRLAGDGQSASPTTLSNFERFKVVFYTACARSYIESIAAGVPALKLETSKGKKQNKAVPREVDASVKEKLQLGVAKLSEAEVSFLFGIEPLSGSVPLLSAYSEWTFAALLGLGIEEGTARQLAVQWEKEARERFRVFLAGTDPVADWMRRYLAIAREDRLGDLVEGLSSVAESLHNWTEPQRELKRREEEAWADYRETLKTLPDLKETMFNEQFGVRKVFVKPEVTYHVAGAVGDAGKPQKGNDIGRLLGALISTRTTGEDLIILCGGPGSGKSTLCRILAAQLASDPQIHPIFVRLRRLKEGSDIGAFIEESLQKLGAISRLSDLRDYPNLVVILDGFDELVMASRARLRQFFNILREEHSSGALRRAKIVVSGRDTLFPQGDGLPNGSHVVTLLPFDRDRVAAWCEKWRAMHAEGPGATFDPSQFLEPNNASARSSPLKHLVSWPLTLHLVARVHTTGLLNLASGKAADRVEKAYLYRSILAETAQRQEGQADTEGRLKPERMREFLRDLAWQMYAESRDSMDPAEVMPILAGYFKGSSDAELAELADVAVVNSPELSKGEETGFEFVHKSFSEYLVAERMALSIEHAIFQAPTLGCDELTWRMSDEDATRELAPYLGMRLLTEEVQEMLEPMVGSFIPFLKGGRVSEVVSAETRANGLRRIVERLEALYRKCVSGEYFHAVVTSVHKRRAVSNPLEVFSHYCAGVVLIGVAAARQLRGGKENEATAVFFEANPVDGAFWRWISILSAGGLQLDKKLALRLFDGLAARPVDSRAVEDRSSPLKLGWLSAVKGYRSTVSEVVAESMGQVHYLQLYVLVLIAFNSLGRRASDSLSREGQFELERMMDYSLRDTMEIGYRRDIDSFVSAGLFADGVGSRDRLRLDFLPRGKAIEDISYYVESFVHEFGESNVSRRSSYRRTPILHEMIRRIAQHNPKIIDQIVENLRRLR